MAVFVAELQGEAVAIFNAEDDDDAREYIRDETFQEDLLTLERGGKRVWDGAVPVGVRSALKEEENLWQEGWDDAEQSGDVEEGNTLCAWLIEPADETEPTVRPVNGGDGKA